MLIVVEIAKLAFPGLGRTPTPRFFYATRIAALAIAAFQGRGLAFAFEQIHGLVIEPGATFQLEITLTLVAATALLGWLGDRISFRGAREGFWLLLIAPWLAGAPRQAVYAYELVQVGVISSLVIAIVILYFTLAIALIVLFARAWLWRDPQSGAAIGYTTPGDGLGFVDIWPSLLAKYVPAFVFGALLMGFGGADDLSFLAVSSPIHVLITAALIAAFAYMRAPADSAYPVGRTVFAQILICCSAELLTRYAGVPFALDGALLIVVVATLLNCAASLVSNERDPRRGLAEVNPTELSP